MASARLYVTVKGTRKQAEAELAKLLDAANRGVSVDPSKLTVAEHLRAWLDGKSDLSPLTRQAYTYMIDQQINPTLGTVELQKLKPADVAAWLTTMRKGKRGNNQRSARTIRHAYRVLHGALKSAVRHDMVGRNVADHVEPPKPKKPKVAILTATEVPASLPR